MTATFVLAFAQGAVSNAISNIEEIGGIENTMYQAVFTVVDKGNAEAVIDAATSAGSRGATIINAKGSGIHENNMLFSMPIEPEKKL